MSFDSEREVLGTIICKPNVLDDIVSILVADDFQTEAHRAMFRALVRMSGMPIDPFTLLDALRTAGDLDLVGQGYVLETAREASCGNPVAHARIVRNRAIETRLVNVADNIIARHEEPGTTEEKLDAAQREILSITEAAADTEQASAAGDLFEYMLQDIDARAQKGDGIGGKPTGIEALDEATDGLQDGDLIIIGGRPSMGKTVLAMQMAEATAEREPVLVESLEMPGKQLMQRMAASRAGVPIERIRRGNLSTEEWGRLNRCVADVRKLHLFVKDNAAVTIAGIRAHARQIKRKYGLGLVVIDYLQLMKTTGQNRVRDLGEITGSLKRLARELGCPIVLLSQLSRSCETRPDKRPFSSDLRDSGEIEQDADLILLLYRDIVYNPNTKVGTQAEILIRKQRMGTVGTVYADFDGQRQRFNPNNEPIFSFQQRDELLADED